MKERYVIASDLGTGGCKSSLYDSEGRCLDSLFKEYPTFYPAEGRHEQRPDDWFEAVKDSIKELLESVPEHISLGIAGIGLSGHSLGLVPLDREGSLLMDSVPIWSDSRPGSEELEPFFSKVSQEEWYLLTGNGFPPNLYTLFKILWIRNNHPDLFNRFHKVIGTKDYINYKLTGRIATDFSYASGSGIYDLKKWDYSDELIKIAGLERELFPDIVKSTDILGFVHSDLARELGLPEDVNVVAGGVDNSCMALGAKCYKPGRLYNSLGSSSWIAVSSKMPLLDTDTRPYVFTHVVPGQFASATAIFSAGSSYKWFANILSGSESPDFKALDREADTIQPGSEKLYFNPSLAGGSSLDDSPNIRGAFLGLSLSHGRAHMVRSVMEGIGFGLRVALDALRELTDVSDEMTIVGGGSKSPVWRQILADIFGIKIVKTSVDQQAAALGAAALALYGCGIWEDFSHIDKLHEEESTEFPDTSRAAQYEGVLEVFKDISTFLSGLGDRLQKIN